MRSRGQLTGPKRCLEKAEIGLKRGLARRVYGSEMGQEVCP